MPESILSISHDSCPTLVYSTSVSNGQARCFLSETTEFNDPCQNSCSPGSVEEVSSQLISGNIKMSHLNRMDRSESCNQLWLPEFSQALRKLEEQLSLDNEEDASASTKEQLLPFGNPKVETHDLQLLNDETRISQEEALQNLPDEYKQMSNDHIEDGTQFDNILKNSDMGFDQSQFGAALRTESSMSSVQRHLFAIREVSPEWAFSSESTKVVITGDFLCRPSEYTWSILFGDIEVPLEIVQDGVFRCLAPPHSAGKVTLCITSGNSQPCSEVREFEFREKLEITSSSSTFSRADATKSTEELLFLLRFVQILLSAHISASIPQEGDLEAEVDPLRKLKRSKNRLEPIIKALLAGSMASDNIMDAILQELLKDKLHQWLSSKHQGDTDKGYLLSKHEQCIIHMISGLGYQWALHPILNSGLCINYRDSNGWTALHWAARFGREKMVAALLAAGASAGAVTNPSADDPQGKTPASLAAANGHKGLAGYLSEAALTSHLFSLTTEKTERFEGSASVEVDRGVDSISQRNAHSHGGTEDQRSLKDSLAAARNAAQAAARIQAAFRAYSFRKKQQKTAICQGQYDMSPADVHELSVASRSHKAFHGFHDQKFDKAALSIQKNYQCWKKRKEFLQLRKNVVKIQARVRGHLARKKYEFLWTVGVLEKVILRWHRKGIGLRGFQAEPESLGEAEEDEIIKVFRRQKVDKAIDEALSRVLSVVGSPEARQQYRRMLASYQQAKAELRQWT